MNHFKLTLVYSRYLTTVIFLARLHLKWPRHRLPFLALIACPPPPDRGSLAAILIRSFTDVHGTHTGQVSGQRGHQHPFHLNSRFLWVHWPAHSQSLPSPASSNFKIILRTRSLECWPVPLSCLEQMYSCPFVLFLVPCHEGTGISLHGFILGDGVNENWRRDVLALEFVSPHLQGSEHCKKSWQLGIFPWMH